jgi:hypothetical protein
LQNETDSAIVGCSSKPTEEVAMVARLWRGWTGADSADEVAAHLRDGIVARYAAAPGNVSACVLRRSSGGGVELMTLSLWESDDAVPRGVDERHRLLVASETIPACWDLVDTMTAIARAA